METLPRGDPFWISRKNAKHKNPWNPELDYLIETHFEDGFLGVESRFWISCFTAKYEFPISKSKSRFVRVKHPEISLSTASSFWLAKISYVSTQFLNSYIQNGGRVAVNLELKEPMSQVGESVSFDNCVTFDDGSWWLVLKTRLSFTMYIGCVKKLLSTMMK